MLKLDDTTVMQLFGDNAYIERDNCAARMNHFISFKVRFSIYRDDVGFIPEDNDVPGGEMNRARDRRSQIIRKLDELITILGGDWTL